MKKAFLWLVVFIFAFASCDSGGDDNPSYSEPSLEGMSWVASGVGVSNDSANETLLVDVKNNNSVAYTLINESGTKTNGTSTATITESGSEITLTFTVIISETGHTVILVWGGSSAEAEMSVDGGNPAEAVVASKGLSFYKPKANEMLKEDWHEEAYDGVSEKVWCTYKFTNKSSAGEWSVARDIFAQNVSTNETTQRGETDTSITYNENSGLSEGNAHRYLYQTSRLVWGRWGDDPSYRKTDTSNTVYGTYESDVGETMTITRSGATGTSSKGTIVFTNLRNVENNAWSLDNTNPETGVTTTYYFLFDGSGTQKFGYKVDKLTKQ